MRFFYFLEMTPQKIFTIKELIEYIRNDSSLTSAVTFISILYKPSCAVTKKNTLFNKDVIFFTPINIKVFDHNGTANDYIKELVEAHKNDRSFKFRPKPKSQFEYLDDMAEEI